MVNASLNWASIVGIVLAVCGGGLYFLRSFKPALARDYDVFFAAIGLLCGGILFFQGWRLDPILQFGQFLLAGTTVFFAYESVRLMGVATDQLEDHLILMMILFLMFLEILEADLMKIMIGLKNQKVHPEDLNHKKKNFKKTIRRGDLEGGMFQELYPLLQQVEVGHLRGE